MSWEQIKKLFGFDEDTDQASELPKGAINSNSTEDFEKEDEYPDNPAERAVVKRTPEKKPPVVPFENNEVQINKRDLLKHLREKGAFKKGVK